MPALSKEVARFLPIFKVWADDGSHPSVALDKSVCVIGRREVGVNLPLHAPQVSKLHAVVVRTQHQVYVRDLASRNGVQRNGAPVQEVGLSDEDVLRIGSYTLRCLSGFGDAAGDGAMEDSGAAGAGLADVKPPPSAKLIGPDGATYPFPVGRHTVLIGHREGCEVRLEDDQDIAPVHAIVFEIDGARFVRDLGAPSGTFLNHQPVHQSGLSPGDEIRIGRVTLRYALADAAADSGTAGGEIDDEVAADEVDDAVNADAAADVDEAAALEALGVDDSAPGIDLVDSAASLGIGAGDSVTLPEITMEDSRTPAAAPPDKAGSPISEYDFDVIDIDPRGQSTFAGEVVRAEVAGAGANPVTADDAKPARPQLPPVTTTPQRSLDDSAIPIAGSFHDRIIDDHLPEEAANDSHDAAAARSPEPLAASPSLPANPALESSGSAVSPEAAAPEAEPPAEDGAAVQAMITQLVEEVTERVGQVAEKVEMVAAKVERVAAKMTEVAKDVSEVAETAGTLQEVWSDFRDGEAVDRGGSAPGVPSKGDIAGEKSQGEKLNPQRSRAVEPRKNRSAKRSNS